MTSLDHPIEQDTVGLCGGCRRWFSWRGLAVETIPQRGTVIVLCGLCRWRWQPREPVCCLGDSDAQVR